MLQYLVEQLNEYLSRNGVITDVVLRSEQSLVEEEETQEVTISFVESEMEGKPQASIHLFLLGDDGCEVEVEIAYPAIHQQEQAHAVWEQIRRTVPEAALTEKRRYLEPGSQVESTFQADYHFTVDRPANEKEEEELTLTLNRFAADLGALLRL